MRMTGGATLFVCMFKGMVLKKHIVTSTKNVVAVL